MIQFRRMLTGDSAMPVKDYTINTAYAATAKVGDLVKLNATGEVVKAVVADAAVLGIFLGFNIKIVADTVFTGKVRVSNEAVYEVSASGTAPVVGGSYAFAINADGTVEINGGVTANPTFKVVAVKSNGNYEAIIHPSARQIG